MNSSRLFRPKNVWTGIVSLLAFSGIDLTEQRVSAAEEKKPAQEKITYAEHVQPIFRQRCGSCHNASDKRGGLALDNYAALMAGGSSGDAIEAGDAGNSYLYSLITHASEPKMPPNADKLPATELAVIEKWINLGAPENAGSSVAMKKKPNLAKIEVSTERPKDVAIPTRYFGDPAIVPNRPNAVTALASSPWAPVTAVSGHRQVTLFDSKSFDWLGVLPYPEGQPQIIKFSRDGSLLMVGGGRGGLSGRVIVYDVKTGERKIEVGDEYDEVLAADISSDLSLIALGSPKKMLRIYSTESGELLSENKKHTDWITALEFSPDGVLLASGDRSNGLIVWEASSGSLFYDLQGHKGAITDISWRPDSNVVASSSQDNTIKLWEMENGKLVKSWDAHGGGATSVDFTRDGQLVSVGRDKVARLWNGDGAKVRDFNGIPELGMEISYDAESKRVLVGDWGGQITIFNADDGQQVGKITTNPPTVPMQVAELQKNINALKGTFAAQQKAATDSRAAVAARAQVAQQAQAAVAQATDAAGKAAARKLELQKAVQAQQTNVANTDAKLKAAQTTLATAAAQLKQQSDALANAVASQKSTVNRLTQANTALAAASQTAGAAKQRSDDLKKSALPTAEETGKLETDSQVKQAVAERQKLAAAAEQAGTQAEAARVAAQQAVQLLQQEAAAVTDAINKLTPAVKTAEAAQAMANAAVQGAQQELAGLQKTLNELTPQFTAAQQSEQATAKALADAQAAAKKATDAAAPTADEQKAIAAADAAVAATQGQLAALEAKLARLLKIQNELTTALQSPK